jgi:hypothetical protein
MVFDKDTQAIQINIPSMSIPISTIQKNRKSIMNAVRRNTTFTQPGDESGSSYKQPQAAEVGGEQIPELPAELELTSSKKSVTYLFFFFLTC